MTIEAVVARWGLPAIFLGAGIEGETAVVTGGVLAHQGLVSLVGAGLAAVLGSFVADQLFFAAGRHWRDARWIARWRDRPAFARALGAIERHPVRFVLAFRFLYGLRTVSPIAAGTSAMPTRVFLPLNALAATIWGVLFTGVGYVFGEGIAEVLGEVKPSRETLWAGVAVVAAIGAVVAAVHQWRARRAT